MQMRAVLSVAVAFDELCLQRVYAAAAEPAAAAAEPARLEDLDSEELRAHVFRSRRAARKLGVRAGIDHAVARKFVNVSRNEGDWSELMDGKSRPATWSKKLQHFSTGCAHR